MQELEKSLVRGHYRRGKKTGRLILVHPYEDSRHRKLVHAIVQKGDRIKASSGPNAGRRGTVKSVGIKTGQLKVVADNGNKFWVKVNDAQVEGNAHIERAKILTTKDLPPVPKQMVAERTPESKILGREPLARDAPINFVKKGIFLLYLPMPHEDALESIKSGIKAEDAADTGAPWRGVTGFSTFETAKSQGKKTYPGQRFSIVEVAIPLANIQTDPLAPPSFDVKHLLPDYQFSGNRSSFARSYVEWGSATYGASIPPKCVRGIRRIKPKGVV